MKLLAIPTSRLIERAGIATVVLAGHACLLLVMAWEMHPVAARDRGDDGVVVMASLVTTLPAQPQSMALSPPARRKPATAKPKPASPEATMPAAPPETAQTDPHQATDTAVDSDTPILSDAETLAVADFEPAASQGDPLAPCDLTATLAASLAQSPAVRLGLDELPIEQRSVANAVMLWDGQWPDDSRAGGKALLRALLQKAVSAARPDCLTMAQRGPILFLIPDDTRTVVLAVGSGQWTWGDLLQTPTAMPADYLLTAASVATATP